MSPSSLISEASRKSRASLRLFLRRAVSSTRARTTSQPACQSPKKKFRLSTDEAYPLVGAPSGNHAHVDLSNESSTTATGAAQKSRGLTHKLGSSPSPRSLSIEIGDELSGKPDQLASPHSGAYGLRNVRRFSLGAVHKSTRGSPWAKERLFDDDEDQPLVKAIVQIPLSRRRKQYVSADDATIDDAKESLNPVPPPHDREVADGDGPGRRRQQDKEIWCEAPPAKPSESPRHPTVEKYSQKRRKGNLSAQISLSSSDRSSDDTLERDLTWLQYHEAVDSQGRWTQSAIRRRLPLSSEPPPPYLRVEPYRSTGWLQEDKYEIPEPDHPPPATGSFELCTAARADRIEGAPSLKLDDHPRPLSPPSEIQTVNPISPTPGTAGIPPDRDLGNKFAASPSEPDYCTLRVHSAMSPFLRPAGSGNEIVDSCESEQLEAGGRSVNHNNSLGAARLFGHPLMAHRADSLDSPRGELIELVVTAASPRDEHQPREPSATERLSTRTSAPKKSRSEQLVPWDKSVTVENTRQKVHKFLGGDRPRPSVDHHPKYTADQLQAIVAAYTRRTAHEDVDLLENLGGEYQLLLDLAVFPNDGLNEEEKPGRRKEFGANTLPQKKMTPFWKLLWEASADPMLRILMAAAIISIVLGVTFGENPKIEWIEGAAIFLAICIVVAVTATNDYFKEIQFSNLVAQEEKKCSAIRNEGQVERILFDDLVVGDVLVLETGDEVPADALMITATDIKVDESSLTGEPDHILKRPIDDCIQLAKESAAQTRSPAAPTPTHPSLAPPSGTEAAYGALTLPGDPVRTPTPATTRQADHHRIPSPVVLSGTAITSGCGKAIVVAVGPQSQTGKLFTKLALDSEPTPLQNKLNALARDVGRFGFIAALVTLFILVLEYWIIYALQPYDDRPTGSQIANNMVDYIVVSITIIVVAVPEGLPLAVTISLAFSVGRMLKDMNYVRRLAACETMGGANEICSDKTGTLTKNQMEVEAFWNGSILATNLNMEVPADEEPIPLLPENFLDIFAQSVSVNSTGYLERQEVALLEATGKQKKTITRQVGSPTECALLLFIEALGYHYEKIRRIFGGTEPWSEQGLRRQVKQRFPRVGKEVEGGDLTTPDIFEAGSMIVHQVPFNSDRKIMSTIVRHPARKGWIRLYTKGAAEIVLHRCSSRVDSGGTLKPLNQSKIERIEAAVVHQLAQLALRTICVAYRDIDPKEFPDWQEAVSSDINPAVFIKAENDLVCLGICGIRDPLREEVPAAVKKCQEAGIRIRMCTGDNLETAKQIALKANIYTPESGGIAMLGAEFLALVKGVVCANCGTAECACERNYDQMGTPSARSRRGYHCSRCRPKKHEVQGADGETVQVVTKPKERVDVLGDQAAFEEIADRLQVLARSQPNDKYALVTGLKNRGAVVAVTGDGTNDAPALKKADVGFAMGITGKEVAKQAADIVLLDDNFESIVRACKWGRNIYDNIQRFLQFQLTVNAVAVITALVGAVVLRSSPLNAVQLLWVNLIMDTFAALALATEMPTDKLLRRPPHSRKEYLVSRIMFRNMLIQIVYQVGVMLTIVFSGECWLPEWYDPNLNETPFPDFNQFSRTCGNGHTVRSGRRYFNFSHDEDYKQLWTVEITPSRHYTYVFNIFVMMQAFNLLNARKIGAHEYAIFRGVFSNWYWLGIMAIIIAGQILLVEFGGLAVGCHINGLTWQQWLLCLAFGVGSWVVAFLGKLIPASIIAILPQTGRREVNPLEEPTSVALASRGRISSGRISHRMHIMSPEELSRFRSQLVSSLRGSGYTGSSRAISVRSLEGDGLEPSGQNPIVKAASYAV